MANVELKMDEVEAEFNIEMGVYTDSDYTTLADEQFQITVPDPIHIDAVFFRTGPLFYRKFENMVIFRSGNLYSLYSPENQDYHKIIHF